MYHNTSGFGLYDRKTATIPRTTQSNNTGDNDAIYYNISKVPGDVLRPDDLKT
jgi:hypothetical protein